MAMIKICDMCGERIFNNTGHEYRIQKQRSWMSKNKWDYVDICDDCRLWCKRVVEKKRAEKILSMG